MLAAAVLVAAGCGSPFEGKVLAAWPVDGEPVPADWDLAVPLDLTVWMGNVHERPEVVALDREVSHRSTAQCHHGPSSAPPVPVRLAALYSADAVFIRVRWEDPTRDEGLGRLVFQGGRWAVEPEVDDGIAILWGPPDGDGFRCQQSCHMREVDVYDGGTQMRMVMQHPEGALDLWRWRAGVTAPFGLADDMVVDGQGKRGDEGQGILTENFSGDLGPGSDGETKPAFSLIAPLGRQADVKAAALWERGAWQVTFRRQLDTADPDDRVFRPGPGYPFAVSVFDSTRTEHHVAGDGFTLILARRSSAAGSGGNENDPMDY